MADLFTEKKKEVEWQTFLLKRRKKLNSGQIHVPGNEE